MIWTSTDDIFNDEIDKSALSILVYWERREKHVVERAIVTEVETMEFFSDGTGVWNHWDDSDILDASKDTFIYHVVGCRLFFKYASFPDRNKILDFKISNGYLILTSNKGMPDEYMEVYTQHVSLESKLLN